MSTTALKPKPRTLLSLVGEKYRELAEQMQPEDAKKATIAAFTDGTKSKDATIYTYVRLTRAKMEQEAKEKPKPKEQSIVREMETQHAVINSAVFTFDVSHFWPTMFLARVKQKKVQLTLRDNIVVNVEIL